MEGGFRLGLIETLAIGGRTIVATQITIGATDARCSTSAARTAKRGGKRSSIEYGLGMEPFFRSSIMLQLSGDHLDPIAISEALNGTPSLSARAGGPVHSNAGDNRGPAKTGACSLRSNWDNEDTPEQKIASIFAGMTQDIEVWREIVADFSGRLLCHVECSAGRQAFRLLPSTLAMVEQRGLSIIFVLEREIT